MRIAVLDHGYVEFIEAWGHGTTYAPGSSSADGVSPDYEAGIIEAARQSTQGSFRGWEQDAKLLKHLYDNRHATPFEFAGMVIEVQAPIFVFREWHRHRTQSYNEMSARYAPLPDLHYEPDREVIVERGRAATANRQAGSITEFRESAVDAWRANLGDLYRSAEQLYRSALASGIPKELARLSMPVGHYSRMRAQATLRNWLAFLTLRMDPLAQWEIRQFANAVGDVIAAQFPQTWKLFRVADATPAGTAVMTPEQAEQVLRDAEHYGDFTRLAQFEGRVIIDGKYSLEELEALLVVARHRMSPRSPTIGT